MTGDGDAGGADPTERDPTEGESGDGGSAGGESGGGESADRESPDGESTDGTPVEDEGAGDGAPEGAVAGVAGADREAVPDFVAAGEHVRSELVGLARRLRAEGATVPANAAIDAARALVEVGLDDRGRVRAALSASLVADERGREAFADLFPEFWYRLRTGIEASAAPEDGSSAAGEHGGPETAVPGDDPAAGDPGEDEAAGSERVLSRSVDPDPAGAAPDRPGEEEESAASYSAGGEAEALPEGSTAGTDAREAPVRRFERALANLRGRRWRSGEGRRLDARRALRESLGTGGTALTLPRREARPGAFRTCLLVDVSQSVLDTVDRELLVDVARRLQRESRRGRTFLFDTEIREVTPVFADAGPDADPLAALRRAEVAWGGGTRIGDAVLALRDRYPDAVDRRTVAVVISDGLDVGEMDALEDGMVWLSRRAAAVLWLNPLAATEGYEPTCRGMATALPYVDGLFAFAGAADLAEAARQIERRGLDGPLGYEYERPDRARSRGRRRAGTDPEAGTGTGTGSP